jgi:hypothetical protein
MDFLWTNTSLDLHCLLLTYGGALFDGRLPRLVRSLAVEAVDAAGIDQRKTQPANLFTLRRQCANVFQYNHIPSSQEAYVPQYLGANRARARADCGNTF